jgi:putative membrane-bound dehydrogenase-like protein
MMRKSFVFSVVMFGAGLLVSGTGHAGEAEQTGEAAYAPHIAKASDEGENAIKRFRLQPGFKATLFAAEPMLANPVAIDVDGKGRVYVVETFRHGIGVDTGSCGLTVEQDLALRTVEERVEFMKKRWGAEISKFTKEHDRIRLIEDTNGDGIADRDTVFAQRFNGIPDGLGAGVMELDGSVYYTCIPHVWKLRDTNNDGVADEYEKLSSGYGVHGGYLGHDLHGLRAGPDGKIYYTIGDRGAVVTHDGKTFNYPDMGTCWRCNPDGSELEVFAQGLRNPQELTFDDYGNVFTGDNNSDGGDKARWVYIVEGGDSGWRQGYQFMPTRGPWNAEKLWYPWFKGQAAYIVPPVANYINGPSGLTYYPGTGMSDNWKGYFFLVNFSGGPGNSGVLCFTHKTKGAGFEQVDDKQFVWNLLATDCEFGPDGGLYISDWVQGWGKPNKGRVYRVGDPGYGENALVQEVKKLLPEDFTKKSAKELEPLLAHADRRVRQKAQFALAAKPDGIASLQNAAAKSDVLFARLHAIWGLGMAARKNADVLKAVLPLLGDGDAEVRAQAAKVLGDARNAAAFDGLLPLLKDPSARVRMFAAMALGKIGNAAAIEPLCALIREVPEDDPWLRHGGVMGLSWLNQTDAVFAKASDASDKVRMAVLLMLRRAKDARIAQFLNDKNSALALEAARAINDEPIPEAQGALAAVLKPKEKVEDPNALKFKVEYWLNLKGGDLGSLTNNPNYPAKPDRTVDVTSLEAPQNAGDEYGARLSGVLTAPQDGDYVFYINADDVGELWLSSDENPANKKKIARCPQWTPALTWDKYPEQTSQPVALKAGQKVYLEAIFKEGNGDDICNIGWKLPDGKYERPIGAGNGKGDEQLLLQRAVNANYREGKAENAALLAAFAADESMPSALRAQALQDLAEWAQPFERDRVINLFRPLPARDAAPAAEAVKPLIGGLLSKGSGDVRGAAALAAEKLNLSEAAPGLFALVGDVQAPVEARIAGLKALAALKDKNLLKAINVAMADKQVKLRQEGNTQLAKLNPDQAIPSLEKVLENGAIAEKQGVLPILARMKKPAADAIVTAWMEKLAKGEVPAELQLDAWEAGKASENKAIRDLAGKFESTFNVHDEYDVFKVALKGGDADNGKRIFYEHTGAQCLRCHKLNGEGGDVGPELKGVAGRGPREYLLESVVNPSAKIAQGFEQVLIQATDGKVITGIVKGESDKDVTVLQPDGKPLTVAKAEIKSRKVQKLSAMPAMGDVLNKFEIRDIVEFLSTLK